MKINIKKLNPNAIIPTKGSDKAAGYDLYACMNHNGVIVIKPHTTMKINTGLAMAIPDGYFGAIFARSGTAVKKGLRPANCVGVVDSDYRGEVIVALHNDTDNDQTFVNGDRIAQLVIMEHFMADFYETEELDDTDRGDGGFGSTGDGLNITVSPAVIPGQIGMFDNA